MVGVPLSHMSQHYQIAHPALNSREVRIATQNATAKISQSRAETALRNISFAASAAAHTAPAVSAAKAPAAKPAVAPSRGSQIDIKV
ncbi:MAG: hypothetical protein WCJ64_27500 [Rhodospirillaceae bacterium]